MMNKISLSIRVGTIRSVRQGADIRPYLEVHCAHLKIIQFIGNSIGGGVSHLGGRHKMKPTIS